MSVSSRMYNLKPTSKTCCTKHNEYNSLYEYKLWLNIHVSTRNCMSTSFGWIYMF